MDWHWLQVGFALALSFGLAAECGGKSLFGEIHVVKAPKREFGYRSAMGSLVELKDGTIMMSYTQSAFAGFTELPSPGIVCRASKDQGKTWGGPVMLVKDPAPGSTNHYFCHPCLFYAPNGDLMMSYLYCADVPQGQRYYGHTYYRRSTDEGKTWSDQFMLTPGDGYLHAYKQKVISGGRIIAPTAFMKIVVKDNDHAGHASTAYYSDDSGYTWRRSENDIDMYPIEVQEPHITQLKDGRLMMTFRTYNGNPGRSFSSDRGKSWSKGELTRDVKMSRNASYITVERIPSTGDLLLVCATGEGPGRYRTPLAAYISQDDGATWKHARDIADDPDEDYGYQTLMFLDDTAILAYHKRDGLYVARIGSDWFYDNK